MSDPIVQIASAARPAIGPISLVVVQATTFCNLNCSYCYLPDRDRTSKISAETIKRIFESLLQSTYCGKRITVVWHAGEPMSLGVQFYKQALGIAREVIGDKIHIVHSFQTNGTLINDEWCDLFSEHNVRVGVSLDGPAFIHDTHRLYRNGKPSFEAAVRGFRLLTNRGLRPAAIAVVTAATLPYPEEFHQFFVDEKVTWLGINLEEIEGINKSSTLLKEDNLPLWRQFVGMLYRLSRQSGLFVREFRALHSTIVEGNREFNDQAHPLAILSFNHRGEFSTYSPEMLSMGEGEDTFLLGNIHLDSIDDMLMSSRFKQITNDILLGVERCRDSCGYFNACGGGAPSNKLAERGSLSVSETLHCRFKKMALTDVVLGEYEATLGLGL